METINLFSLLSLWSGENFSIRFKHEQRLGKFKEFNHVELSKKFSVCCFVNEEET